MSNLVISGEQRVEKPVKDGHSVANTGEITVMVKFRLNKLNSDVVESTDKYVNFFGKSKNEGGVSAFEYYFRYYNVDSPTRPQRMSFYHFNPAGGLGAGSYVEEAVAVGETVTLIGRVNTSADRISLSKNGVLRDTDTLSSYSIVPEITNAPLTFGRIKSSISVDSTVDMTFEEASVWNRELTDAEVADLELGIFTKVGLVDSYYRTPPVAIRRMTHSLSFDKVDDYVEVPDAGLPASSFQGGFTLSGWIMPKGWGESNLGEIFNKSTGTLGQGGFMFRLRNDSGQMALSAVSDGGTQRLSGADIKLNIWQHVALTVALDGTVSFYINGGLSGTPAISGVPTGIDTTNALRIGNRATATDRTFDGLMSGMGMHFRELSATEALNLYQHALTANPDVEYFNNIETDGAGSVLTDSVGSNNGTISGATWSTEVPIKEKVAPSKATHGLVFTDNNEYVDLGNDSSLQIGDADQAIFARARLDNHTASAYLYSTRNGSDGELTLLVNQDGTIGAMIGTTKQTSLGSENVLDREIHNIGIVYSKSEGSIKYYLDGVVIKEDTSLSGTFNTTVNKRIGVRVSGSGFSPNGSVLGLVVIANTFSSEEAYNLHHYNVLPEGVVPVAQYFNSIETDGAGTVLTDSAGSNDGTISGATWLPLEQPKAYPSGVEHVLSYGAGVGYKVDVPWTEAHYTKATFRGKFRIDENGTYQVLGHVFGDIYLRHQSVGNNGIRFFYFDSVGSETQFSVSTHVADSVWHNLIFVFDADADFEAKLYLDGTLLAQKSGSHANISIDPSNSGFIRFGANSSGNYPLDGESKDNLLWLDTALTAQQVLNLYTHNIIPKEGLVGNWNEISDDGTTLIDNSGQGNDGTITGAVRVAGCTAPKQVVPYVGSLETDGVNDYVDLGAIIVGTDNFSFRGKIFYQAEDTFWVSSRVGYNTGDEGFDFSLRSSGVPQLRLCDGLSLKNFSAPAIVENTWIDICCTIDRVNSVIKIYYNGVLVAIDSFTLTGSMTGSQNMSLAKRGTTYAQTKIAGFSFWKGVTLTTPEIETMTLTGVAPQPDSLVLDLQVLDGRISGSTWTDASKAHNDGTITGATVSTEAPSKAYPQI